jgi:hypothetical protein
MEFELCPDYTKSLLLLLLRVECLTDGFLVLSCIPDFTRLKSVKAKKIVQQEDEAARKKAEPSQAKENDEDITAGFDATDDADVVF